jgi:hypothetical protein
MEGRSREILVDERVIPIQESIWHTTADASGATSLTMMVFNAESLQYALIPLQRKVLNQRILNALSAVLLSPSFRPIWTISEITDLSMERQQRQDNR